MAKKKSTNLNPKLTNPKLTEGEQDLLSQLGNGYELETDSLGGNLVLRRVEGDEVIRPMSGNAGSVKALQQRGPIHTVPSRDPLTLVWRLTKK